jgi:inorganic triphosphatase YgiF
MKLGSMSEIELKLIVDPAHAAAVGSALRRLPVKTRSIESRYFDTADRRLAEAGLSLRLRKTGRAWEQTLKAPGANAVEREEDTVARSGRWPSTGPPPEPALHAGTDAGKKLLALLDRGERAAAALGPVYSSVIVRRSVEVDVGDARVEVAFDRGAILAGAASEPLCEVEYELVSGDPGALVRLARAGVMAHGMCLSTVSKAVRGDRLACGESGGSAVRARPPRIDASMSGPVLMRGIVRSCLEQILGNASEIADGHVSDERVHELRVGLRRLRTASRELGRLEPAMDRGWEASLTAAFRELGDYRDRTAVAATLQSRLAAAGSPAPSISVPTTDTPDPAAIVRAGSFQCALLDVLALVLARPRNDDGSDRGRTGGSTPEPGPEAASAHIGSRLDTLHRRLARGAKTFERSGDSERHAVRKRLKRLRYMAELVAPLYKAGEVRRYVGRLKPAQDELGAYVDLVVSSRMARDAASHGVAEQWFNAGWLAAQLTASARRCKRSHYGRDRACFGASTGRRAFGVHGHQGRADVRRCRPCRHCGDARTGRRPHRADAGCCRAHSGVCRRAAPGCGKDRGSLVSCRINTFRDPLDLLQD